MECKHGSDEEYNGPCTLCLRDERRQHKEAESEHEKEYAVLRAQLAEKTAECERLRWSDAACDKCAAENTAEKATLRVQLAAAQKDCVKVMSVVDHALTYIERHMTPPSIEGYNPALANLKRILKEAALAAGKG
jgi:hypothetical protein